MLFLEKMDPKGQNELVRAVQLQITMSYCSRCAIGYSVPLQDQPTIRSLLQLSPPRQMQPQLPHQPVLLFLPQLEQEQLTPGSLPHLPPPMTTLSIRAPPFGSTVLSTVSSALLRRMDRQSQVSLTLDKHLPSLVLATLCRLHLCSRCASCTSQM